jgi:hypothetical protein
VKCSTASDAEVDYENLSIKTGGLRFPVCATDYSAIFDAIATETVAGASLSCTFTAEGQGADPDRAVVVYIPGSGGDVESLQLAPDVGSCADGAYVQDGVNFTLCEQTCDRVQLDTGGKISVALGCESVPVE